MSRFADVLIAIWILFVGVVYFGAPFSPRLWLYEPALLTVYVVLLIGSVVAICLRWLGRSSEKAEASAKQPRRRT